jgi:hypothetical protein
MDPNVALSLMGDNERTIVSLHVIAPAVVQSMPGPM